VLVRWFMAPRCPFCSATAPALNRFDEEYRGPPGRDSACTTQGPRAARGRRASGRTYASPARRGLGSIEARMAFYGHLFLVPGQMGDDRGEELWWLKHVVERATKETVRKTDGRELAYVAQQMDTEQGTGSVARSAIASLAKISWFAPFGMGFAERFFNRSLAQVTPGISPMTGIRSATLESVFKLIGPETQSVDRAFAQLRRSPLRPRTGCSSSFRFC
jgi:hypothetical protein